MSDSLARFQCLSSSPSSSGPTLSCWTRATPVGAVAIRAQSRSPEIGELTSGVVSNPYAMPLVAASS